MDLNKCSKCKKELVIGGSGTICCVNDDCDVEVIGLIYNEPVTIEENFQKLILLNRDMDKKEELPYSYNHQLKRIDQLNQTQISLEGQLRVLRQFANKLGLYDASDYLKK